MSFRDRDEDLFEDSRMSFGAHLEELRWVLVKCLIALAIGCCFGFYFAENVVQQLKVPLKEAIDAYRLVEAKEEMIADQGYIDPDLTPWLDNSGYVPQKTLVDPAELLRLLQTVSPDLGEKVELNPYEFVSVDFKRDQIGDLLNRLVGQDSEDADTKSKLAAIWKRVPTSSQAALKKLAGQSTVSDQDLELVVEAANTVIAGDLSDDAAFAETLSEPAQGFLSGVFSKPKIKPLAKMKASPVV